MEPYTKDNGLTIKEKALEGSYGLMVATMKEILRYYMHYSKIMIIII